jgi:phosphoglycolate phosphatase-like HAD superfamily hydrolase
MKTTRRLILWDIDGTLLSTGTIGRHALEQAAASVAGINEIPHVVMSGKTDQRILREILVAAGLQPARIDELVPQAMAASIEILAASHDRIANEGTVHPGVGTLVDRLASHPGVRQSLVTGNLAPNARVKVGSLGLDTHIDFETGAYGDDHHDRNELVPMAIARVRELRGETYAPDEIWVIGDTEHDLACARAAGVRCLFGRHEVGRRRGHQRTATRRVRARPVGHRGTPRTVARIARIERSVACSGKTGISAREPFQSVKVMTWQRAQLEDRRSPR